MSRGISGGKKDGLGILCILSIVRLAEDNDGNNCFKEVSSEVRKLMVDAKKWIQGSHKFFNCIRRE